MSAVLEIGQRKNLTANEFFYSPLSQNHELIKGEIVPTDFLGTFDGHLLAKLNLVISEFVRQNRLGIMMVNVGFILASNPDTVRGANLAFISKARLADTGITEKFYPSAPNFIAEVASETRPFEKVKERADEFLQSGTEMVWIVNHQKVEHRNNLTVNIFRADGTTFTVEKDDEVSGENVFEGFELFVSKLLENQFI